MIRKKKKISKSTKKKKKISKSIKKKEKIQGGGLLNDCINKIFGKNYTKKVLGEKLLMQSFNKKFKPYITIDDIDNNLSYQAGKDRHHLGLHIGQRKLLLSEVQFLNNNTQKYCIYPGSAPSHKTHFLSKLFPNVKFILVDPNIFEIKLVENNTIFRKKKHKDIVMLYNGFATDSYKYSEIKNIKNKLIEKMDNNEINDIINFIKKSNYKIYIIEDYMTDKLSSILKKLGTCNFISDIRSNVTNTNPVDFDIIWNRSMVHNWISILQPEISMVKFRIPYFNEKEDFNKYNFAKETFKSSKTLKSGSIDFLKDYSNKKFRMSKATLYLQPWSGPTSTEMRGWIKKQDIGNIINYDMKKIEDTLFYYNRIKRVNYHENKYTNESLHFCNCNDCAIESTIWQNYINNIAKKNKNFGKEMHNIKYYINLTNNISSRPLHIKHNQTIYNALTADKLNELLNIKNMSTQYGNKINRGNTGIRNN